LFNPIELVWAGVRQDRKCNATPILHGIGQCVVNSTKAAIWMMGWQLLQDADNVAPILFRRSPYVTIFADVDASPVNLPAVNAWP
jgi:hypothetical protein